MAIRAGPQRKFEAYMRKHPGMNDGTSDGNSDTNSDGTSDGNSDSSWSPGEGRMAVAREICRLRKGDLKTYVCVECVLNTLSSQ
jgi:hypothetical protein